MSRHRRPSGFQRTDRIADQIQRELSRLLQFQLKDPRVGLVTVQDVTVSRDLSYSDVYFTLLGEGAEAGYEAEKVLTGAAGFLGQRVAAALARRNVPLLLADMVAPPNPPPGAEIVVGNLTDTIGDVITDRTTP